MQDKNFLYNHDEPKEPTKEAPISYVLRESPLAAVSTVSRGHPSLVSLDNTYVFFRAGVHLHSG
jgi:hypothetical protein